MRRQPKWNADRPTRSKTTRYDHDNSIAASIILADQNQHTAFQLDWALRFQRRRAEELRLKSTTFPMWTETGPNQPAEMGEWRNRRNMNDNINGISQL